MALEIRARIDKWGCIKLKSFCRAKETITKIKTQLIEWEKIFSNFSLDKGLISRIQRVPKIKYQKNKKYI
jgi:hypothetical protein